MASGPKLITATPLTILTYGEPHVVFGVLKQNGTPAGAMVCAFHPESGVGGSVLLNKSGLRFPERSIRGLIDELVTLSKAAVDKLHVKLIGTPAAVESLRIVIKQLGAAVVGEFKDPDCDVHAYFYTDSGRLRVAPAETLAAAAPRGKRRVLIVDDSKTIRQLLSMMLGSDPNLEVVGAAELPSQAEKMIEELRPDVITLDIHMPEMSGVDLLQRYLPRFPIPTVMISSISMEEGNEVLRALELGAVDYIQKPSFEELEHIGPLIVEKVRTASLVKVRQQAGRSLPGHQRLASGAALNQSVIVAIGASTGGTEALRHVFTRLPAEIPPIVVVQHIPPVFSKAFANRMSELCPFEVKEAEDKDEVRPNRILIAPGGLQMAIEPDRGGFRVRIKDDPPVNRHKPSVDYMFDTVARHIGKKTIGVILTGMGRDGAAGLLKMRQAGARTIAQDEATSVVFGMPKEAIKLGAAEVVRPLDQVSETLITWLQKK